MSVLLPNESQQQLQDSAGSATNNPPKAVENRSQQTHVTQTWDTQDAIAKYGNEMEYTQRRDGKEGSVCAQQERQARVKPNKQQWHIE